MEFIKLILGIIGAGVIAASIIIFIISCVKEFMKLIKMK
jgi:hypothetical protein